MQVQALHRAEKSGWAPPSNWWTDHHVDVLSGFSACAQWVANVPVMPTTVLGLELLLQERSLDLQMASDVILKDVGATLLIMLLAHREASSLGERPARMVDCLLALDGVDWFTALTRNVHPSNKSSNSAAALWKHCRNVGCYARLIAESLEDVCPEQAYLAGLLHEVDNIPHLLGQAEPASTGGSVKLRHILPTSLLTALESAKQRGSESVWRYVLASAHALATAKLPGERSPVQASGRPFVV